MTTDQILSLGPELAAFLAEFSDCFGRPEPRRKLEVYVRGQLGELPRKSVEPIALAADVKPRTLQEFLASDEWNEDRMRARLQEIVARDHADPQAIGVIDDSGHPKKGTETAGVSRQYCGNTGKVDNCVTTVHLTYTSFDGKFHTMLDSESYLPRCWHEDRARCRTARIPDDIVYRPKYVMALEQLDRAMARGIRFAWITADEWYSDKGPFLRGLEERGLRFVLEIPGHFMACLTTVGGQTMTAPTEVRTLCRRSPVLKRQPWQRYLVKDTDKGPMVWEVKAAPCWLARRGFDAGPYWLVMARNVLDPNEIKYFLSNAPPGTPLPVILHVGFGRWPVERCLQDEKSELGLSHFEVRCYPALKRHLLITQVSHLFLARQAARLRGEKCGDHPAASSHGDQRLDRRTPTFRWPPNRTPHPRVAPTRLLAASQRTGAQEPHQNPTRGTRKTPHRPCRLTALSAWMTTESAL